MQTPCPSSELRLLRLLRDGRWHGLPQIVRTIRSYRVSSAVYRARKLGFKLEWRLEKKGTAYRLCS